MGKVNEDIIPILEGNKIFDFILRGGNIHISCYQYLKKKVIFKSDKDKEIELVDEKTIDIESIEALEEVLLRLVEKAVTILRTFIPNIKSEQVDLRNFSDLKVELLIEQLVFDILRDKYTEGATRFNRYEYANYISKKIYGLDDDEDIGIVNRNAVYENITGAMEKNYELMSKSMLKYHLLCLGIDFNKCDKYYNSKLKNNAVKERTLFEWNNYYFNYGINMKDTFDGKDENKRGTISLTTRQHRRQVDGKGRKHSYEDFFYDLKKYCEVIEKFLPKENEDDKTYFEKTMEYFFIESYKRIDYMFKLIEYVPQEIMAVYQDRIFENYWGMKFTERFFLCERFCPAVAVLYENDGNIEYIVRNNYYRPLIKIEEAIIEDCINDGWEHIDYFNNLLQKHYLVRAKTYELFNYYYKFKLEDYPDIKKYLEETYDMCSYHNTTEVWKIIKKYNHWKQLDSDMKKIVRKKIKYFKMINSFFFWESKDREIKK